MKTLISRKSLSLTTKMKSFQSQRLQIFDQGERHSMSGIRATIFGATGFMGPYVGAALGYISSDLIFPHNHRYPYDDDLKELKLCAASGQAFLVRHMNFEDLKMIDRVIANSNVVINMVGPRKNIKYIKEFEYINVLIAKRIAEACRRNPNVIRLIQFSACGAAKNSPSADLSTKAIGEEAVLDAFPNATIFRPTTVYGMNDYFTRLWLTERNFFYNFNIVTDDCTAKRQPILVHDVASAVLNALKLHETCGKTYELGGPHVYSRLEIYDILHNLIVRPPKLAYFPYETALKIARIMPNWDFLSLDTIIKNRLDIVVDPKARKIDELFVRPVNFT